MDGSRIMSWPPRSPDLTPRNFFIWGVWFIKSKVYAERHTDILDLKNRIRAASGDMTIKMRVKTIMEYRETRTNHQKWWQSCGSLLTDCILVSSCSFSLYDNNHNQMLPEVKMDKTGRLSFAKVVAFSKPPG